MQNTFLPYITFSSLGYEKFYEFSTPKYLSGFCVFTKILSILEFHRLIKKQKIVVYEFSIFLIYCKSNL